MIIRMISFMISNDIKIFDKCFSPKTVVLGNNQQNTFEINLFPFSKMEKLNP